MRRIFRFPWRTRTQIRRDLDEELDFHLDMRAAELTSTRGLAPDDARREAIHEFGDVDYTRRYCLDLDTRSERMTRRTEWLDDLRKDTTHAWRALRRTPGFTTVALITLALGVGATSAMYSVLERTLLMRLPYAAPDRLVRIYGVNAGNPRGQIAAGDAVDFRTLQHSFTGLAAFAYRSYAYTGGGEPRMFSGMRVSSNLFDVLGARPMLGRTFALGEDQPSSANVVVISYRAWHELFGDDLRIVGRTIVLNDLPRTVIGVMPPGFFVEDRSIDVWAPLDLSQLLADVNRARKYHFLGMVGRLKPGVTLERGISDLAGTARRLEREYPESNTGYSVEGLTVREWLVGQVRTPLLVLTGAAAMVLLIACANVASLLLTRTIARRQELGIRSALGAGRGRIVRQLLTESSMIAIVGGALGLAVAYVGTRALAATAGSQFAAALAAGQSLHPRVLLVTLATAVATVVVFGVGPALAGSHADLRDALHDGGRASTTGRTPYRARAALVAGQAALAVVLLVGAGLLTRSLYHLHQVHLGFDASHLLTFRLGLPGGKYDTRERGNQFYEELQARLRALPGVDGAATTGIMPLRGGASASLAIRGRPIPEGKLPEIGYVSVSRGYFETMRIPLSAGRVFDARDNATSTPVVVIGESVAKQHWPNGDAVGAFVRLGPNPADPWAEVIGVVGDVRQFGPASDGRPTVYAFALQDYWDGRDVMVRARGDAASIASSVRQVVRQLDPNLPLVQMRTMDEVADEVLAQRRLSMTLMSVFAGLALALAAVGLYGVMSYVVTARTREFGVRMALGAPRAAVMRLVVRQGLGTVLVGLALGLIAALAATRLLVGLLFGVKPLDPLTFGAVPAVLLAVALFACWLPARRATRVDPMAALRTD
jgi:putative ABC transport system permease protein